MLVLLIPLLFLLIGSLLALKALLQKIIPQCEDLIALVAMLGNVEIAKKTLLDLKISILDSYFATTTYVPPLQPVVTVLPLAPLQPLVSPLVPPLQPVGLTHVCRMVITRQFELILDTCIKSIGTDQLGSLTLKPHPVRPP